VPRRRREWARRPMRLLRRQRTCRAAGPKLSACRGAAPAPPAQTCQDAIDSVLNSGTVHYAVMTRVLNDNSFSARPDAGSLLEEDEWIVSVLVNRAADAASGDDKFNLAAGGSSSVDNQATWANGNSSQPNNAVVNQLLKSIGPQPLHSKLCDDFLQDIGLAIQAVSSVIGGNNVIPGIYWWFPSSYAPAQPPVGPLVGTKDNTSFYAY